MTSRRRNGISKGDLPKVTVVNIVTLKSTVEMRSVRRQYIYTLGNGKELGSQILSHFEIISFMLFVLKPVTIILLILRCTHCYQQFGYILAGLAQSTGTVHVGLRRIGVVNECLKGVK